MKTRPIAAALLIALAPAAFPSPAFAQSGAEDPITAMARARFKEGVEFYDKGEYEQARASFLQAYALKKHPAVLLNLAWSCLKSGHALEAEKYFRQFLAEGKDITDKQRADANDGLNQTRAKLGRIEIQAAAGTDVTVDGDHVGTAPLPDPVPVEAGAHTVKFKGADGSSDVQSVSVLGGEKAIARFGRSGGSTAAATGAATTTTPTPPATTEPAATPPPAAEAKPAPESTSAPEATPAPKQSAPGAEAPSGGGLLSPPSNLIPVFVFAGAAVAGYGVAIAMLGAKNAAQNNANTLASEIAANVPAGQNPKGICNKPSSNLSAACSDFVTDNNDVNTDATIGNIALGVGVAATLGTVVYWLVADKGTGAQTVTQTSQPVMAPIVGPHIGGLSLSGSF